MIDVTVNTSIEDFCKELLKKRFPGEPLKHEINDTDRDKLNFACPFCGDSKRDPNKKRGNLYLTTHTYKCYNDGCETWIPLEKFVSILGQKYSIVIPNLQPKKIEFKLDSSPKKKGSIIEFLINRKIGEKLLKFSELVDRFSLAPCVEADPASPVGLFIERRKLNHLPVFEKSCYFDSKQDKIYIFNLDLKSDRMLGFAMRYLDDFRLGPKYNIKTYSEFKRTGLVKDLEDDLIQEIDSINNYFNILNIDFTKDITVTEGQIDAMFVDNCIASSGVSKSKHLLTNLTTIGRTRILFDNDQAGKKHTMELLRKGYRVFLWMQLTVDLKKKYPAQLKTIRLIKDINDLYKFLLSVDSTINYPKFNEIVNKYFSNSPLDILFI